MGESRGPCSSLSQAGWAGAGWSPKAERLHSGLFKAWRARDPEGAEVTFVPRVSVTQVAGLLRGPAAKGLLGTTTRVQADPTQDSLCRSPAPSRPVGILLAPQPRPGPWTVRSSCTIRGQGCHPASSELASQALPAPWAQQGPHREARSEGAERLGPRWPTAALQLPSEARAVRSVLASAHTEPPGDRQPKPAWLQCRGAESFLSFPPTQRPSNLHSPSSLVAVDAVHHHGAYCGPSRAGSPTAGPFGGRRGCLMSPPALGVRRRGQDPHPHPAGPLP